MYHVCKTKKKKNDFDHRGMKHTISPQQHRSYSAAHFRIFTSQTKRPIRTPIERERWEFRYPRGRERESCRLSLEGRKQWRRHWPSGSWIRRRTGSPDNTWKPSPRASADTVRVPRIISSLFLCWFNLETLILLDSIMVFLSRVCLFDSFLLNVWRFTIRRSVRSVLRSGH